MDLSLRAYLKGWKAIFLDDVTCLNEVRAAAPTAGRLGGWLRVRPNRLAEWVGATCSPALHSSCCPHSLPSATPPHPQLPASFFAYRKQQHRWTCGPIQLWSKAGADIWRSQVGPCCSCCDEWTWLICGVGWLV